MSVPTLEELFEKFRKLNHLAHVAQSDAFEQYWRLVASGQAKPELRGENAVFAAECFIVLLEHVKREAKGGDA